MADAGKKPSGSSSPKSKKRKMSKADKERMKKEEQERKAQEEALLNINNAAPKPRAGSRMTPEQLAEQARIKALEEAKTKKKEAAAAAIEKAKQENVERKRRRQDMTELQEILDRNEQQLQELNQKRRVSAKWARYMRCDGSPDPVNQGEINTYINLRLEDRSRDDADSVLIDSQLDLALIEELQFLLRDSPSEELPQHERFQYNETIEELEKLIQTKLDLATLQILCDASELANGETGNLQHVVKNDSIALCVWGNIMKNPRVKSFEFPEIHFTFDVPRVLALSDCAVRVMITVFDHFSPTSKATAVPRRMKKEEPEPVPEAVEEKKEEEVQEGGEEGAEKGAEEEKEETELDLMAALRASSLGEEEESKEEEEPEEEIEEDFPDPPTPEPTEWEDFDEEDDIIDLRANDVLGGIFEFNLLQMPPQPKTVGSWTITQLVEPPEISHLDYVADPPAPAEGGKDKEAKKDEKPPIAVHMNLPENVLFLEEPQIARWDYKSKFWTNKGFSDFNYNEEARTFSFKTTHFGTICLLQDSHINMPFQSWEIRPHKTNSAVLTITAAIVEIEIEIKDALCCLSQPKDKPELESVRDRWVTPAELIVMLRNAGVNVFPNEDSSKFVSIQNKHPLIEQRLYQQMALTASSMAYSWSKWNGERERGEIVFQGAEALEDVPLLEEDWSVFLATKRRVSKLKMTEFDDEFSEEKSSETELQKLSKQDTEINLAGSLGGSQQRMKLAKFTLPKVASSSSMKLRKSTLSTARMKHKNVPAAAFHKDPFLALYNIAKSPFKSNLYHLLGDFATEKAQERVRETNFQFIDCVHQLLKATKVLTYA